MDRSVDWRAEASKLTFRTKAFINDEFVDAHSGETFECVSPIDGRVLASVAACGSEDVDVAVKAARRAFEQRLWSDRSPKTRKRIMVRFAELIAEHADELALLETLDMGKPISDARDDLSAVVECVRWYGEAIDKLYDEIAPTPKQAVAMITREPLGVVGAVVPWNFPLLMAAWKFAPALAAGNSMIVKPAEKSPLSILRVAELGAEAGIPAGAFNVVPGFGETAGQALGRHMDVDAISFTGSTEVGKLFLTYSGDSNMKAVSLECGGKSPNIVFAETPDLEATASAAISGVFYNSGQICDATSRLLVEQKIHDALLDKVVSMSGEYIPADPLDPNTRMGPLVDRAQMERVLEYIAKGKSEGANLSVGGDQVRQDTGGFYISPTIFDGVTNDMTIAREEIFGPVLAVIPFRGPEEALRIANDSAYGLKATLWTNDIKKAHSFAKSLRAGTVIINGRGGGGIEVPFGGYKQSGFGRDKSLHALEKYTQLKTTFVNLR